MKTTNSDKITLAEAKSALFKSGYLLESRIEQFLSEKNFFVEANTVYPDPSTQKSREFDLYATKSHSLEGRFSNWVKSNLFFECVNNPQPIAFITKDIPYPDMLSENIKVNGLPTKVKSTTPIAIKRRTDDYWFFIEDFLEMGKYHHYCSSKISTQFCSFTKKKNNSEWMASHEDSHFESFQKLCDVINYYLNKLQPNNYFNSTKIVNLNFFYPVIVVQGELLDVRVNRKKSFSIQKSQHIQFVRSHILNSEPTYYQIDIITESYIHKYIEIIEAEMIETINRIKQNIGIINESIKEITDIGF